MISARIVLVSIPWAVLSVATLICAQDVKPSAGGVMAQPLQAIQELELQPRSLFGSALVVKPVSMPLVVTPDLSRYRDFQFGMTLLAVAKQASMKPSEARVIHERPAVIQELQWRPEGSPLGSSPAADSVREVLFTFYNGGLFRMVVNYDRYRTEGLTDEDMIGAISTKYGAATRPAATIIVFSSFQVYNDTEKVIARWENPQYSINLFRSSYQPTYGMLVFSKQLDALAQVAIVEANRLDELEAPQREMELQKQQDEKDRAAQEKARLVNKASFRP
jgi:hypothetical protein